MPSLVYCINLLHQGHCFCDNDSDQCSITPAPIQPEAETKKPPTTPTTPKVVDRTDPGQVLEPTEPVTEPVSECPAPPTKSQGDDGDPCLSHTACFTEACLICVRQTNKKEGTCQSVTCSADEECSKATALPSQCNDGQCTVKQCGSDEECPQGMGCFNDGNCKTVRTHPHSLIADCLTGVWRVLRDGL